MAEGKREAPDSPRPTCPGVIPGYLIESHFHMKCKKMDTSRRQLCFPRQRTRLMIRGHWGASRGAAHREQRARGSDHRPPVSHRRRHRPRGRRCPDASACGDQLRPDIDTRTFGDVVNARISVTTDQRAGGDELRVLHADEHRARRPAVTESHDPPWDAGPVPCSTLLHAGWRHALRSASATPPTEWAAGRGQAPPPALRRTSPSAPTWCRGSGAADGAAPGRAGRAGAA